MSINSINNSLLSSLQPTSRPVEQGNVNDRNGAGALDRSSNAALNAQIVQQKPVAKTQQPIGAATQSVVPAEAPAGTDPTLWSVLTTEERTFFAKTASLGPLTYGRIKAATQPAPPAPRGVRLDVRA